VLGKEERDGTHLQAKLPDPTKAVVVSRLRAAPC
jgi:hypothetical protein